MKTKLILMTGILIFTLFCNLITISAYPFQYEIDATYYNDGTINVEAIGMAFSQTPLINIPGEKGIDYKYEIRDTIGNIILQEKYLIRSILS